MSQTVLVIDDEADIRTFLTVALRKAGYQTVTATNGVEAWEIAKSRKPDLVILDIMMPRQSGTDFYRALADDDELCKVPVVIVSGVTGTNLTPFEPAAVFDKPIKPDVFIAAVNEILGKD